MAPYNYNTYDDPAGSQASQPQGYAYQGMSYPSNTTTSNSYAAGNYNYGNADYGQKPSSSTPTPASSSNYAAAASGFTGLGGEDYSRSRSGAATERALQGGQYDHDPTGWRRSHPTSHATASGYQMPNKSQAEESPVQPAQTPSATREMAAYNAPETHAQPMYPAQPYTNSICQSNPGQNSFYPNTYDLEPSWSQAPQRQQYASPVHVVQAQQNLSQQRHSPHMDHRYAQPARQHTASTGPSAMTVDPSQVYDNRAAIETERRRAREAVEAERFATEKRAEEERLAQEKRAEEERLAAERIASSATEMARRTRAAEAKKSAQNAKQEQETSRKVDERNQVESGSGSGSGSAANALQRMASGDKGQALNHEEAEMREMCRKMREFNQRNPAMLAKLWEEERESHAASQSPQPKPATAASTTRPEQLVPVSQPSTQRQIATRASASPAPTEPTLKPFIALSPVPTQSDTATISTQSAPTQAQANMTHVSSPWPPKKKTHLAEAATKWLQNLPENTEKRVHVEDVLRCLDENPSYIVLCGSLEALGLQFDRAQFARELLRAVPEIKSQPPATKPSQVSAPSNVSGPLPQQQGSTMSHPLLNDQSRQSKSTIPPATRTSKPARSAHDTVPYETPSFSSSLTRVAREINEMDLEEPSRFDRYGPQPYQQQHNSSYFSQQQPPLSDPREGIPQGTPVPSIQPGQMSDVKPSRPPRLPADKEEAARKRNFSDLIDLTNDQDSDDDAPPSKMIQSSSSVSASQAPAIPMSVDNAVKIFQSPNPRALNLQQYQFHNNTQGFGSRSLPRAPTAQIVPSSELDMPISFQTPPLDHAAVFDPGKEPVQKAKPKGPSEERKQIERITGKMLVEPIMRDRVARRSQYDSRTIARDVLLATGRHPEMRGLNHHLSVMQKLLGDHGGFVDSSQGETRGGRSDLATIRWDLLDPGDPLDTAKKNAVTGGTRNDKIGPIDEGAEADGEEKAMHEAPQQFEKKKRGRRRRKNIMGLSAEEITAANVRAANETSAFFAGGPNRRKTLVWDSRQTAQATPNKQTTTINVPKVMQQKVHKATPPMSTASRQATPISAPTGYAAFRHVDADGNVVKTKGRPVGWRKALHSREAQGLTPTTIGQTIRSTTTKQMDRPLQQPHYQIYACRWRNCNAELHNLDNLKKHLIKMHGKKNDVDEYECLWQGCDDHAFEDMELWLGHINEQHLEPIAWKLGDGPKGGMTVTSRDPSLGEAAYLSDASGRSVTPMIFPRSEDDFSPPGSPFKPTASDPTHELDELRRHKQIVGFVFERNGCRFANAKRRMGFLDDEDFEDVIEELPGEVEPLD